MCTLDRSKTYYEIVSNNSSYKLGLNTITDEQFYRAQKNNRGLYFCSVNHIFQYINYGKKLCILTIPDTAKIFRKGNIYLANQISIHKIVDINYDIADNLIKNGANIIADNNSAVRLASGIGYLDVVKCLVDHGADVTACDNDAIRRAATNGHSETVKYLIEHGADVNADDNYAIRHAAKNGHLEVVKCLIEHGADATADKNCAICWAAQFGRLEVVKFLVKCEGVNVAAHDNRLICSTVQSGPHANLEVIKFLVEQKADAAACNNKVVRSAAFCRRWEIVEYLIEHGADITAHDNYAVIRAAEDNDLEAIKILVGHGADAGAEITKQ